MHNELLQHSYTKILKASKFFSHCEIDGTKIIISLHDEHPVFLTAIWNCVTTFISVLHRFDRCRPRGCFCFSVSQVIYTATWLLVDSASVLDDMWFHYHFHPWRFLAACPRNPCFHLCVFIHSLRRRWSIFRLVFTFEKNALHLFSHLVNSWVSLSLMLLFLVGRLKNFFFRNQCNASRKHDIWRLLLFFVVPNEYLVFVSIH